MVLPYKANRWGEKRSAIMVNQNISQTERDVDIKEVSDKCSYLITANAPRCSEQNYRGAIESGLYPLKPPQWNGSSNRRQVGEVLLVSTVVAIVRLLLVMSGDVEENPGPLGEDPTFTFKNVLTAIQDVVDWKSLGDHLDISATKIDEIDVNNQRQVADCRRALVQYWLQSDVSRSWEKLIGALKAIDQSVLAERIRTTYCSTYQDSPLITSSAAKLMPVSGATSAEATTKNSFIVGMLTGAGATIGGGTAGAAVGHFILHLAVQGVLISCAVGAGIGIAGAIGLYFLWQAYNTDEESQKEKKEN